MTDIRQYLKLLENAVGPNAEAIKQFLTVRTTKDHAAYVVLTIPVNQTVTTDTGATVEIQDVEMAAHFPYKLQTNSVPTFDKIEVTCNIVPPHEDADEDDVFEYNGQVEDWLAGNFSEYLTRILIDAGFSRAAANSIQLESVFSDMLEYQSDAIGEELLQVAGTMLNDNIHNALKKYGVPILSVYTNFTADDLTDYKTDIIKTLLTDYKNTGKHSRLVQILDNLDQANVNWPELSIIKRSLDSL